MHYLFLHIKKDSLFIAQIFLNKWVSGFVLLCIACSSQLFAQNWPSQPANPIPSNTGTTALETEIEIGSTITTLNGATLISVFDPWTKPLPTEPSWLKSWSATAFGPSKGSVYHEFKNNRNYFYYRPYPYAGGNEQFIWPGVVRATNGVLQDHNFTFELEIADPEDIPIIRALEIDGDESINLDSGQITIIEFPENSVKIADLILFDPDPTNEWENPSNAGNVPGLSITSETFELVAVGVDQEETDSEENGWYFTYELRWLTAPLNFESLGPEVFQLQITATDTVPVDTSTYDLELVLKNVPEEPRGVYVQKFPSGENRVIKTDDGSDGPHEFVASIDENPNSLEFDFKVEAERFYNAQTDDFEDGNYTLSHILDLQKLVNGQYITHPDKTKRLPAASAYQVSYYKIYDSGNDTTYSNPLLLSDDAVWMSGDEGRIRIEILDEDFFTFDGDWLEFKILATDESTKSEGNFMIVQVEIENDFDDAITFNQPSEIPILYKENNTTAVFDFDPIDPDSHPISEYRTDNNESDDSGAQIFYRLSGADADLFHIDENGSLFFISSPNFEDPRNQDFIDDQANGSPNLYAINVQIHDQADFSTAVDPANLLIVVEDANDPPFRTDPFASENFSITTFEGQPWNFETRRDLIDIRISDEDGDLILWDYISSPDPKGQISLSNGRAEDGAPDTFLYSPDYLRFGDDLFTLRFSDGESPYVDINFSMFIQNDKDLPSLGYVQFDGEPAYFEIHGGNFGYYQQALNDGQTEILVQFDENSKPSFSLPFSDLLDEQNITSVVLSGSDESKFEISEIYQREEINDPLVYWVDLNFTESFSADYENPEEDGNYTIKISVFDEEGSFQDFYFTFETMDVDEPAYLNPNDRFVISLAEETEMAITGLRAIDPEGQDKNYTWRFAGLENAHDDAGYFKFRDDEGNFGFSGEGFIAGDTVDLLFAKIPSFENINERELNASIQVSDRDLNSRVFTYTFQLFDEDDPPRIKDSYEGVEELEANVFHFPVPLEAPETIDGSLGPFTTEPVTYPEEMGGGIEHGGPFDLSNYFGKLDEDNQTLRYSLVLPREGYPSPSFQNRMEVSGTQLYFKASSPPDYENSEERSGQVMVGVTDGLSRIYVLFDIVITPENDPPELLLGSSLSFSGYEDTPLSKILSSYFHDVDNPIRQLTFDLGPILRFGEEDPNATLEFFPENDSFTFSAPPDQSGVYEVEINFYDEPENNSTVNFRFDIEDVPDKPEILLQEEFFEANAVSKDAFFVEESEEVNERYLRLLHLEGEVPIAELYVSDYKDSPPASSFTWGVVDGTGMFRIDDFSEFCRIYWDLPAETNNGLPDYESMGGQTFEFYITVQENVDPGDMQQLKVVISVEEVPNKRPVFVPSDPRLYIIENFPEEGETDVLTIAATDPDNQPGSPETIILKTMLSELDYQQFVFDELSGKLSFVSPRDYESPKDLGMDNRYQTIIRITEFNDEAKSSEMLIEVQVQNNVEPPSFGAKYDPVYPDANFSIVEQKVDSFEINASTLDQNKDLLIEISQDGPDDHLFEFNSTSNRLSFLFPPDYENPESEDGDNMYEVHMQVSPVQDGKPSYGDRVVEPFYILVLDDNFTFEISEPLPPHPALSDLQIFENELFVVDIDVFDAETPVKFPDLLYITELGAGFIPHQKTATKASLAFDESLSESVSGPLDWTGRFARSGDMRNAGINDVVVLTSRSILYFENDGAGEFTSNQELKTIMAGAFEGSPTFAMIEDINFDGALDLLVCYHDFAENKPGIVLFINSSDENLPFGNTIIEVPLDPASDQLRSGKISQISVQDLDGDYDLDLVVAYLNDNEVLWYANDGEGAFTYQGMIASVTRPRALRMFNFENADKLSDGYACPDLLIGSDEGLTMVKNLGSAGFEQTFLSQGNRVASLQVLDLLGNNRTDLVFVEDDQVMVSLGLASGFGDPTAAFTDNSEYPDVLSGWPDRPEKPGVIEPFYFGEDGSPTLIVGELNQPYAFQLKHREVDNEPKVIFDVIKVVELAEDSGVQSLQVLDLDRRIDVVEFRFFQPEGGEDVSENAILFDEVKFGAGGRLFFKQPPDFESPQDFGQDNVYELVVEARKKPAYPDQATQSDQKKITVEVLAVNEPPVFTSLATEIDHVEHTFLVLEQIDIFNPESNPLVLEGTSFDLAGGEDEEFFEINASSGRLEFRSDVFSVDQQTGVVTFDYLPDFENPRDSGQDNQYRVIVHISDDAGLSSEQEIVVRILEWDQPPRVDPVFSPQNQTVDEDNVLNHPVADLQASDPDNANGGIAGYDIFRDALYGSVTIEDGVTISYQPDGNYSGSDEFFVQALNNAGLPVVVQFKVEVSPINDAPVTRLPLSHTMDEGVGKVLPLLAYDGDGDSVVWTTWLADDSDFKVLGNVLYFKQDALPDYERAGTELGYVARLGLQDPYTDRTEHNLTVFINNLPDSLPSSVLKAGSQGSTFIIPENQSIVADLELADPDNLEDPNATIAGGADAELFLLTQEGVLRSVDPYGFDFEDANDSNADNRYELIIDVNDSALGQSYQVFVVVADQDESPPYYTSGGGETFYQLTTPEDRLFITQVAAEDNETDDLVYRVAKGADSEFFFVDESNGSLDFVTLQNFENPGDSNGDGIFEVVVGVSDGVFETNQTIFVELEDANDPPVLSANDYNLSEDGEIFQVFEGFDEDGDDITYQLQSQSPYGAVTVLGAGFTYRPDADFYGFDFFDVLVSDGYTSNVQTVELLVSPVNDAPVAVDDIKYFYQENRTSNPLILIDVLANDHTGPDDPSEKSSYTVELLGSNSANGHNINTWSRGVYRYEPPSEFMGEDSFQYRLIDDGEDDDNLEDTATVRVWVATTAANPDWTNLMFFGMYYRDTNETNGRQNWIYHVDMGWVYVHRPDQLLDATWMWKENVGWFWTGDEYFKWVYHQGLQQWLHWEGGINSSSGWFLRTEQEVQYYEKDFIRMQVRDEVIEILPSLEGLGDYIENSAYFSDSEALQIIIELNRFGKSSTLSKILQFDFSY